MMESKASRGLSSFLHALYVPFTPPFVGLAPVLWVYFVFCYLFFPDSYVLRGAFVETDNYTYLAQTLDWLRGQGWFDNVQHRLAPPEGVLIHYTRLAELPIAVLTLLFRVTRLPWMGSATMAAIIYPPLLLAGLFCATRWTSESFLPRNWTRATAYTIMFSQALLFQFSPGHVGHRAPVAILILLATGCIYRMMADSRPSRWGAAAGFLLALSLAMALESLPWVLALSAWTGLWLVVTGRSAARTGAVFGLTLGLASAIFLAIYKPPELWFEKEFLSYSMVYVVLAGCIALCCAGVALAARTRWKKLRYFVALVLVTGLGALFFSAFPELLAGPYGAMNRELAAVFFTYIPEAKPLVANVSFWVALLSLSAPFLALTASLFFFHRAHGNERWLWSLSVMLLLLAIALTAFYQFRFFRYANLFGLIPLTVLLRRGWMYIGGRHQGRAKVLAELGLLILVGPLLTVLIPAALDGRPFNTGILMYPMRDVKNACDLYPVEGALQSPQFYGKKPLLIMNTMSTGPEILFRTFHKVMAAPYHYNVRGNLDSVNFFGAVDPAEAEAIARRDKIDLVLVCSAALNIYRRDATAPVLIEQLLSGRVPSWLAKVHLPGPTPNFLLFEVKPEPAAAVNH